MENGAKNVRLGSYDGAWYTESNGTTFVTVSQIFIERGQFFIQQDNIWQTIVIFDWSHVGLYLKFTFNAAIDPIHINIRAVDSDYIHVKYSTTQRIRYQYRLKRYRQDK